MTESCATPVTQPTGHAGAGVERMFSDFRPWQVSVFHARNKGTTTVTVNVGRGTARRASQLFWRTNASLNTKDTMKTILSVLIALVLCMSLATVAYGQSSVQGYNDEKGAVQEQVDDSTEPVAATGGSGGGGGSLPFTGLDVALLVGAGGVLVVAGLGMRRLTRAPDSA